jgi:uncharacterized protein
MNTLTLNTVSGKAIHVKNPHVANIDINDIAAALSKICRFGGHCKEFYSVAQHSVIVMAMAPPIMQFEALMHDAAEAYLGDVIRPVKRSIGREYHDLEQIWNDAIARKFIFDWQHMSLVKGYDDAALELEIDFLMYGAIDKWKEKMRKLDLPVALLSPKDAEKLFIEKFWVLTNER